MTGQQETTLRVEVWFPVIEDGSAEPPRVGAYGEYTLTFREADHRDPSDISVIDIAATAMPAGQPFLGADGVRRWPTELRGLGWRVSCDELVPRTGTVRLHGSFHAWFYGADIVRARIARVQIESVEMCRPDAAAPWEVVIGSRRYRDVDQAPRWNLYDQRDPSDLTYRGDRAVIVDLDLTDQPIPPPRPSIAPAAVAVDGDLAWLVDSNLTLVVCLDLTGSTTTEHLLPEPITDGFADYELPTLWASGGVCWVLREDGILRITNRGITRLSVSRPRIVIRGQDRALVALADEGNTARPHVISADTGQLAEHNRVGGTPHSGVAIDGGFLLLTSNGEIEPENRRYHLLRISALGKVETGPVLDAIGPNLDALAGVPPRVYVGGAVYDVADDLTVSRRNEEPRQLSAMRTVGRDVFGVCHPPDGTGYRGWWPLDGPCPYQSDEQYWLLVRFDPDTLERVAVAPMHATQPSLARHGDDTWSRPDRSCSDGAEPATRNSSRSRSPRCSTAPGERVSAPPHRPQPLAGR